MKWWWAPRRKKTAVAARIDPEMGLPYAVCAYHTRGNMVPLASLLAYAGTA